MSLVIVISKDDWRGRVFVFISEGRSWKMIGTHRRRIHTQGRCSGLHIVYCLKGSALHSDKPVNSFSIFVEFFSLFILRKNREYKNLRRTSMWSKGSPFFSQRYEGLGLALALHSHTSVSSMVVWTSWGLSVSWGAAAGRQTAWCTGTLYSRTSQRACVHSCAAASE